MLDNSKYGSVYSIEASAHKISSALDELIEAQPRMYGKTKLRYQDIASELLSCVDKIAKLIQVEALSPQSNDEFDELAAAGFDTSLDSALASVQQGLTEAKAFSAHKDSDKTFVDLRFVDSIFCELCSIDLGWCEVNQCANLIYKWFHTRFVEHPPVCKIAYLGSWVHKFIIQFGNYCARNATTEFENSIITWCDRINQIKTLYVHPYFIHETLKSDDPNDFTLQAVLINDIFYSRCLYKLSEIIKDKNPSLTPKINTRFAKQQDLLRIVGFTKSEMEGSDS